MGHTLSKEQAQLALAYAYDEQPYDNTKNSSSTSVGHPTASSHLYNLDNDSSLTAASSVRRPNTLSALSSSLTYHRHATNETPVDTRGHHTTTVASSPTSRAVQEEFLRDLAYVNRTYYPLVFSDRQRDYAHDENDDDTQRQLEDMVNDIIEEDEEFERHVDPRWKRITFGAVTQSHQINLPSGSIVSLSPNIGLLYSVTHLNLSNNRLTTLPRTIGHLKHLTVLDVSQNKLRAIPDTISYLTKLIDLNLTENKLTMLPDAIGSLKKLANLLLTDNQITELPPVIGNMKGLITLDLSGNPLKVLPAELSRLHFLRRLRLDNCPLVEEFVHELVHNPPSLLELCARTIVRQQVPILASTPEDIKDYIASAKICSFCSGPYFQSFVKRGKIVEKPDQFFVPLEYRLCAAHWNDEAERIRLMFAPPPETAPPASSNGKGRRLRNLGVGKTKKPTAAVPEIDQDKCVASFPTPMGSSKSAPASQGHIRRCGSISATVAISSLTKKPSLPTLDFKRASRLPENYIPSTNSSTSLASSTSSSSLASSSLSLSLPLRPASPPPVTQATPADDTTDVAIIPSPAPNTPTPPPITTTTTGFRRWRPSNLKKAMSRSNSGLFHLGEKLRFSSRRRQPKTV
ncbi:hypothetical protein BC938DRAFT_471346 [Jimgerdemannia flammicorona]|uniref:Disease resistance R13L4/SHOC-2-like LRR domain-containing protein n=1 Tax=Jimgerdemannia flammicorona TaxID=994334 RepID=A0A433Q8B9_9FUNG|nr:hypothetical protein BC938DRAFT_471346 [Jimgerdemannia flammicorona]